MARIDPKAHASAALAAELAGKSLTKWTEEKLREAAERETQAKIRDPVMAAPTPLTLNLIDFETICSKFASVSVDFFEMTA